MALRVEPPSSPAQLDGPLLREALANFSSLDQNGDGMLTLAEFREGLGMLGMDDDFSQILFNMFNKTGGKTIDQKEFLASMGIMLHPDSIELQVGLAFDAYDMNKDGKLDRRELTDVVRAMNSAIAKMGIQDAATVDAEQIADELFVQMDREGKGYITKSDYLQLANTNPELLKRIGLGNSRLLGRASQRRKSAVNPPVGRSGGEQRRRSRKKKGGLTVAFGHANWEQVVQMMLGIRLSVGQAVKEARDGQAGTSATDDSATASLGSPGRGGLPREAFFQVRRPPHRRTAPSATRRHAHGPTGRRTWPAIPARAARALPRPISPDRHCQDSHRRLALT